MRHIIIATLLAFVSVVHAQDTSYTPLQRHHAAFQHMERAYIFPVTTDKDGWKGVISLTFNDSHDTATVVVSSYRIDQPGHCETMLEVMTFGEQGPSAGWFTHVHDQSFKSSRGPAMVPMKAEENDRLYRQVMKVFP